MTGMAVTCPFVANNLNICQYQLSVLVSDTFQMFKVRLETPGGVQGSGVCAAKKNCGVNDTEQNEGRSECLAIVTWWL